MREREEKSGNYTEQGIEACEREKEMRKRKKGRKREKERERGDRKMKERNGRGESGVFKEREVGKEKNKRVKRL